MNRELETLFKSEYVPREVIDAREAKRKAKQDAEACDNAYRQLLRMMASSFSSGYTCTTVYAIRDNNGYIGVGEDYVFARSDLCAIDRLQKSDNRITVTPGSPFYRVCFTPTGGSGNTTSDKN